MMKSILSCLFIILSFSTNTFAQTSIGGELPNYILSEETNPIVFIYSMSPTEINYNIGTLFTPKSGTTKEDFSTEDEAIFNALILAIDIELHSIGITPQGYLPLLAGEMSEPDKAEEVTQMIVDFGPYYTFTITIMDWAELAKEFKKNNEIVTLSMIKNPAYSIGTTGSMDVSSIYTVYGGKNLDQALDFLKTEIDKKEASYFSNVEISEIDYEATITKNQGFVDFFTTDSGVENSWPSVDELSSSKTLIICEDYSKKEKFIRYAETSIEEYFPYNHDLVKFSEAPAIDLSMYDYVLIPVSKIIEKTKHVDNMGHRVSGGTPEASRTESYTVNRIHYQMKRVNDYRVYLGPNPEKITNHGMSIQPYALRRFLKVFGKQ